MTTPNAMRPGPDREPWRPGTRPATRPDPPATLPDRQGQGIAAWLGWHVLELAVVGVPLGLAVTVDGWFAALAIAAGAGWTGHEIQLARRHRALRVSPADTPKPLLPANNTPDSTGKDTGS